MKIQRLTNIGYDERYWNHSCDWVEKHKSILNFINKKHQKNSKK